MKNRSQHMRKNNKTYINWTYKNTYLSNIVSFDNIVWKWIIKLQWFTVMKFTQINVKFLSQVMWKLQSFNRYAFHYRKIFAKRQAVVLKQKLWAVVRDC